MNKRVDPLHIPYAELVVHDPRDGKELYILNKKLLDQQNAWSNLDQIKQLHKERINIYRCMHSADEEGLLLMLDADCTRLEFELQKLWEFKEDIKFHRFWDRPKCSCPSSDNNDRYPNGTYIIADNCILHGK